MAPEAPITIRKNFWLDLVLLTLLVAVLVTGEGKSALHQPLSIALGAAVVLHLAWHKAALRRIASLRSTRRASDRVDQLLLLLFGVVLLGGLGISPWLTASPVHAWVGAHHILPKLLLLSVTAHLVLHRRWIAAAVRRRAWRRRSLRDEAQPSRDLG